MEGKELNNEDDERNSGSKKNNEGESDDFGLPDASSDSESEQSEENESYEYTAGTDSTAEDPSDEPSEEPAYTSQYSSGSSEDNKSPVGLIVFLSLLGVVIVAAAIYWFFIRTPPEPEPSEPVSEEVLVVPEDTMATEEEIEEPEVMEEDVEEEPEVLQAGTFETISNKTGRYYIVLNSFFDTDMAMDFAKKSSKQGVSTVILNQDTRKGFNRVAINESFTSWSQAESRLNELKNTYGQNIWILKY